MASGSLHSPGAKIKTNKWVKPSTEGKGDLHSPADVGAKPHKGPGPGGGGAKTIHTPGAKIKK